MILDTHNSNRLAKLLSVLLMLVVAGAALVSCQKKEDELLPTTEVAAQQDALKKVKVENGYLVFDNSEEYHSVLNVLGQKNSADLDIYEATLSGFTSLRGLNKRALMAYNNISTLQEQQDFDITYAKLLNIDAEGLPTPKTTYFGLDKVLNTQGIVKVGNTIMQFKPNGRIVNIADGDFSKLAHAQNATESIPESSIFVTSYKTSLVSNLRDDGATCTNYRPNVPLGSDPQSRKKLSAGLYLVEFLEFAGTCGSGCELQTWSYNVSADLYSYYRGKNFWGASVWKDKSTVLLCQGGWRAGLFSSNGPICIDDYQSINVSTTNNELHLSWDRTVGTFNKNYISTLPAITFLGASGCLINSPTNVTYGLYDGTPCCGLTTGAWVNCTITK